jgi:hypothetical protein
VGLLVGHADDVDQQKLGQPVLTHDGHRLHPAQRGQHEMPVALDRQQSVALHPRDRLADRGTALVQSLGDPGP